MGIQKPGLLEQLIINGGLSFVPIQLRADRGFDITYGGQVRRRYGQVHRQESAFASARRRVRKVDGGGGASVCICGGEGEHTQVNFAQDVMFFFLVILHLYRGSSPVKVNM